MINAGWARLVIHIILDESSVAWVTPSAVPDPHQRGMTYGNQQAQQWRKQFKQYNNAKGEKDGDEHIANSQTLKAWNGGHLNNISILEPNLEEMSIDGAAIKDLRMELQLCKTVEQLMGIVRQEISL